MASLVRGTAVVIALLAVAAHAAPPATAPASKFPHPVVDRLLVGWNGLDWGASVDDFKKAFPKAQQAAGGRWTTGAGEEDLAGVKVTPQYVFNADGKLMMVLFDPGEAARPTFAKALQDAGVLRAGNRPGWQTKGVMLSVVESNGGQFVVASHAKYAAPATRPAGKKV
ncbi:MAG TPA: hypothetical protein VF796_01725 [Humisphaera sp.]